MDVKTKTITFWIQVMTIQNQSNNADINTKQSNAHKGTVQIKTHGIVKCVKQPKALKMSCRMCTGPKFSEGS